MFFEDFTQQKGFDDIVHTLGLAPHAVDAGTISMRLPLADAISQANGMYSAAALFGAADVTGTLLAMHRYGGDSQFPLAVQSNMNFLSNSTVPFAVATASILRRGGLVVVVEANVNDAEGKHLLQATFTYVLRDRRIGR